MEFASAGEHNNRNLGIAENGELVGLLEKAIASFGVSDLAVGGVLYPLDLDLSTSHSCCLLYLLLLPYAYASVPFYLLLLGILSDNRNRNRIMS